MGHHVHTKSSKANEARKQKIKQLEEEKRKNKKIVLTQADVEKKEEEERIRKLALKKSDEDCPEAREMESIILRAKCVVERDYQMKLKRERQQKEKEEEEFWFRKMNQ